MLAFVIGWFCTIVSVALGGFLVFRTKRESYEPFLKKGAEAEGSAFNVYDPLQGEGHADSAEYYTQTGLDPSEILYSNSNKFAEQFAESLATRAETKSKGQ